MEELKASFSQIEGFYFVSSLTGQVCIYIHILKREREREICFAQREIGKK